MTLADAALFGYASTDNARPPAVVMSYGMGLDSSSLLPTAAVLQGM
ncbi:hypothetical protein LT337_32230 (plasmid) [Mycolicibacterium fortuitum]|nr:hypothetical protein LT337_32230 [Mycolicibacterium fortuitum]